MLQWLKIFFSKDAIYQPSLSQAPATVKDVKQIVQEAVSALATKEYLSQAITHLATKEYVEEKIDELAQATEVAFQKMATKEDLKNMENKFDNRFNEVKDHFNAAVENIEDSLRGVNRDEILGLKDVDTKLDQRVAVVERQLGLPTA